MKRAIDGRSGKRKRDGDYAVTGPQNRDSEDSGEDDLVMTEDATINRKHAQKEQDQVVVVDNSFNAVQPVNAKTPVGGALQRNPDGTVVAPKIRPKSQGKQVCSLAVYFEYLWLISFVTTVHPERMGL